MHFSYIFNLRYTNRALNIEFATKISDDQCYWSYYFCFQSKTCQSLNFLWFWELIVCFAHGLGLETYCLGLGLI